MSYFFDDNFKLVLSQKSNVWNTIKQTQVSEVNSLRIIRISNNTIKIVLTQSDLKMLEIDFSKCDRNSPEAKKLVDVLLSILKRSGLYDLGSKIYVEIFEEFTGGCVVYITKGEKKKRKDSYSMFEVLFQTNSINELIELSSNLKSGIGVIINSSFLYYSDSTYRLLISFPKSYLKQAAKVIKKIKCYTSNDKLVIEQTKEHYDLLINSNALNKISELN